MQKGSNSLLPVHPTSIKYAFDPGVFRKCSIVGSVELQDSFYLTFLVLIVNLCFFSLKTFFSNPPPKSDFSREEVHYFMHSLSISLFITCLFVATFYPSDSSLFMLCRYIYSNWALHYVLAAMVMICCENVTVGGQCSTRCC